MKCVPASLLLCLLLPVSAAARTPVVELVVDETTFVMDAPDGMGGYVRAASEVVSDHWARVRRELGAPAGRRITISIERNNDDWFIRNDVPSVPPEWAAGLALPWADTILLFPGNPEWDSTLVHELAHLAVDFASGERGVPRWLNEGIALNTAGQASFERAQTFARSAATGGLFDFQDISGGFPASSAQADVAYAQSYQLVADLKRDFGEGVVRRILSSMGEGNDFATAFHRVTNTDFDAYSQAWRDRLVTKSNLAPLALIGGIAWCLVMVAVFAAYRARRRKQRAHLAEMERRERKLFPADPDDTIFG